MNYTAYIEAGVHADGKVFPIALYAPWNNLQDFWICCGHIPDCTPNEGHLYAATTAIQNVTKKGDCTQLYIYYSNPIVVETDEPEFKKLVADAPFPIEFKCIDDDPRDNKGCEYANFLATNWEEKSDLKQDEMLTSEVNGLEKRDISE